MTKIVLYYNQNCPDCVRQAKRTAQMDWFRRVDLSTEDSPLGETPVGEIVVVDRKSSKVFTGVYATRKLCLQVPVYFLYGLLLFLPPVRNKVDGEKPGCNGDACEI